MIVDLENHFVTEAWVSALADNQGFPRLEPDPDTGIFVLHYSSET